MIAELISILIPEKTVCSLKFKSEQKICLEFTNHIRKLTLEGKLPYIWYHIPNEFLPTINKKFSYENYFYELKQRHCGKVLGVPDYCFVGKKNTFFIEFKVPKGKLSDQQKIFKKWCDQEGINYYVCYSAEEGIKVVEEEMMSS